MPSLDVVHTPAPNVDHQYNKCFGSGHRDNPADCKVVLTDGPMVGENVEISATVASQTTPTGSTRSFLPHRRGRPRSAPVCRKNRSSSPAVHRGCSGEAGDGEDENDEEEKRRLEGVKALLHLAANGMRRRKMAAFDEKTQHGRTTAKKCKNGRHNEKIQHGRQGEHSRKTRNSLPDLLQEARQMATRKSKNESSGRITSVDFKSGHNLRKRTRC